MPRMYLKTNEGLLFIEGEDLFIPWLKRRVEVDSIHPPNGKSSYYTVILIVSDKRGGISLQYPPQDIIRYGEFSRSPFEGLGKFLFTDG